MNTIEKRRGNRKHGIKNRAIEWSFYSDRIYGEPFSEIELDVLFTDPEGKGHRVPAFWRGGEQWSVRFSPSMIGLYQYRTICTDVSNEGLHNIKGELMVEDYSGNNPLYRHGAIRVAEERKHFEHADGTPFFWLADSWWGGNVKRFRWPEDFQLLTADRLEKGFTVIQIFAGFPPLLDMFDERGANEAGFPWEEDLSSINPEYFEMMDLRIQHLVDRGLVPCIYSGAGFNLLKLGLEKTKQYWRYLIARWGAYPVMWCACGEGDLPWFHSKTKDEDRKALKDGWTETIGYMRSIDAHHRLVAMPPHPMAGSAREVVHKPELLDFDILQTGHFHRRSLVKTVNLIKESVQAAPQMPVLNGEVCYEEVFQNSPPIHQRFLFWACVLSGAVAGHSYGAAGLWQFNTEDVKAGTSPHEGGINWSETPWNVAYKYPGSGQLGYSKDLLMDYPWWRIESHFEWVEPHWDQEKYEMPVAGGIPGELRIIYFPPDNILPIVHGIESGISYTGFFFNPIDGEKHDLGVIEADSKGNWQIPAPPVMQDWVVVLEAVNSEKPS